MKITEFIERLSKLPPESVIESEMDCNTITLPGLPCGCAPVPWASDAIELLENAERCLAPCHDADPYDRYPDEPCDTCGHRCAPLPDDGVAEEAGP